ncbi:hypothetical protein RCJ22_38495 [Vibrio sp. FNV 38]|nr:hypothetical protein [Vibrio sp. FNV 38]
MKKTILALVLISYPLGATENLERLSPSYVKGAIEGHYQKSESNSQAGIKLQVGNGIVAGTLDYITLEEGGNDSSATNVGFKFRTRTLFGGIEANLHSSAHFEHYGKLDPEYGFHFGYEFNPNLYLMWERDKAQFKDSGDVSGVDSSTDFQVDLVKLGGQVALTNTVYLTGGIGWVQQEIDVDERHTNLSDRTVRNGMADVGVQYINSNGFNIGLEAGYQDEASLNLNVGRYF